MATAVGGVLSARRSSHHKLAGGGIPTPVVMDPIELYKKGRVNDALNCVLDMKSLEKLIELLTLIKTTGGVSDSYSSDKVSYLLLILL